MIKFKIKNEKAKEIFNLKDNLTMVDVFTIQGIWNSNPLNDINTKSENIKNSKVYYVDAFQVQYPKEFIDQYYEEIK